MAARVSGVVVDEDDPHRAGRCGGREPGGGGGGGGGGIGHGAQPRCVRRHNHHPNGPGPGWCSPVNCAPTGVSDLGLCRYWLAAAHRPVRGDSAERQGRCALTTNLP